MAKQTKRSKNANSARATRQRSAHASALRTRPKVRTAVVERKKDAAVRASSHGKWATVEALKAHEASLKKRKRA